MVNVNKVEHLQEWKNLVFYRRLKTHSWMEKRQIFISYSHVDSKFTNRIANKLRTNGFTIWLDRAEIRGGAKWDIEIQNALEMSQCLLIVLTPKSVNSIHVMDEIAFALDKSIPIVPLLVETCDIPLRIGRLHRIDFTTKGKGDFNELLNAIKGTTDNQEVKEIPNKQLNFFIRKRFSKYALVLAAGCVIILALFLVITKRQNKKKAALPENKSEIIIEERAHPFISLDDQGYAELSLFATDKIDFYVEYLDSVNTGLGWQKFSPNRTYMVAGPAGKRIKVRIKGRRYLPIKAEIRYINYLDSARR